VALVPPAFTSDLSNPAHLATLGGIAGIVVLLLTTIWPLKDPKMERSLLAQILASMPLFYLWAAWLHGERIDVLLELLGLVFFGAVAFYGYRTSSLVLAAGIAAHGLLWDSWHHHHAGFMATWYPSACLIYDVAVGIMVLGRVAYFKGRQA
jgi:hypothetical protein